MFSILFTVVVAAQAQTSAPALAAPPANATAPAAAGAPADPPPRTTAEKLADLKVLYDQTCANRAYGAYDDLCENLRDQIRIATRDLTRPPPKLKPVTTAPPNSTPAGPTPPKSPQS